MPSQTTEKREPKRQEKLPRGKGLEGKKHIKGRGFPWGEGFDTKKRAGRKIEGVWKKKRKTFDNQKGGIFTKQNRGDETNTGANGKKERKKTKSYIES